MPATFTEDFQNIAFGVILMPIVIPWGFVYRHTSGSRQPVGVDWYGSANSPSRQPVISLIKL
jgi:hypothetical protein